MFGIADNPQTLARSMTGIQQCSRYAFGPNRLHYCGPDAHRDLHAYIEAGISDAGLTEILSKFQTMFPYLRTIARANHIRDPFDARVVEAYWIGNVLLERVPVRAFHRLLVEEHGLKRKLGASFSDVEDRLAAGALPFHAFHVLNIWRRTGHHAAPHTIESMDACRVSWGTITRATGPFLEIDRRPIIFQCSADSAMPCSAMSNFVRPYKIGHSRTHTATNALTLGDPVSVRIARGLEAPLEIDEAKIGDVVSLHWNVPCEVLTEAQVRSLERYTLLSIQLANRWI